jgi:2,3,4,5-tetrahydropyridine-2-carboxylate N-succinyltransferase
MKPDELEKIINEAFENKQSMSENSDKKILDAIKETIELTDKGNIRVAEKKNGKWSVNQW